MDLGVLGQANVGFGWNQWHGLEELGFWMIGMAVVERKSVLAQME
jgi:hypothetical protein